MALCLLLLPAARAQLVVESDTTVSGHLRAEGGIVIERGATLTLDPNSSVTVESAGNVIVRGTLRIAPASGAVRDTLRILGVDESAFVGGHTTRPLETDRGIWVMGGGRLHIEGTPKTSWAPRPTAVEGWSARDEIRIAPHAKNAIPPSRGKVPASDFARAPEGFDGSGPWPVSDLAEVDPLLEGVYPEVFNLTRNVVIEGQPGARSHIFIHTTEPTRQVIRHAEIKHMGPRKDLGGGATEGYMGRYPLHFHVNGDRSRGSLVEGVVVRQSGHRAFVPHASHGITLQGTIAFDVFDTPYWWDAPTDRYSNASDDITIDRAAALAVHCDWENRGSDCYQALGGFHLMDGENNALTNSVAIGIQGNRNVGGFSWPSSAKQRSDWRFESNVAHNNRRAGIFVWQNSGAPLVKDFTAYHNGVGVSHGAYHNNYRYEELTLVENGIGIQLTASSAGKLSWKDVRIRGGEIGIRGLERVERPAAPVRFENGSIEGAARHLVIKDGEGTEGVDDMLHAPTRWTFKKWTLDTTRVDVSSGTELYEGASGELLTRDYAGAAPVYRPVGAPGETYREDVKGIYKHDYSTRNAPPRMTEMTSRIRVQNEAYDVVYRGTSGRAVPFVSGTDAQQPYGGAPAALPGVLEAEAFDQGSEGVAYHDTGASNRISNVYRPSRGVDADARMIGWIEGGEWVEYTVDVDSAGTYDLEVRAATPKSGRRLHVEVGGADVTGPVAVPLTRGWHRWKTARVASLELAAGRQTLRVVMDTGGFNLDRLRFTRSNAGGMGSSGGNGDSDDSSGSGGDGESSDTEGRTTVAINVGGDAYTTPGGTRYEAGGAYIEGGRPHLAPDKAIAGTEADVLYQSERYGDFSYRLPVSENGAYRVTFRFAEVYWQRSGQRRFDIRAEGKEIVTGLDLYAAAGANTAHDVTRTVTVEDETLDLSFSSDIDNAKLSALVVAPVDSQQQQAASAPHAEAQQRAGVPSLQEAGMEAAPASFSLSSAGPNPFAQQTRLRYALPEAAQVRLAVYDALGRQVRSLVRGERQGAGRYAVRFRAEGLASGVYFARLVARGAADAAHVQTKKLVLVR